LQAVEKEYLRAQQAGIHLIHFVLSEIVLSKLGRKMIKTSFEIFVTANQIVLSDSIM